MVVVVHIDLVVVAVFVVDIAVVVAVVVVVVDSFYSTAVKIQLLLVTLFVTIVTFYIHPT